MSRFEGAGILDDLREALGLALWIAYRDIFLWAGTDPKDRAGLFDGPIPDEMIGTIASVLPTATVEALRELARGDRAAATHLPQQLLKFCEDVSDWASGAGYVAVAGDFAELVYKLSPGDAASALFAGRACKQAGAFDRAEHWYKHAFGLARFHGDNSAKVLALIRRGVVAEQRGERARAYKLHNRAWRGAKRHKLRKLGAYAQHELLVLGVYTEAFEVAQEHACLALRLYGRFDERFPQMAHDTAFLWAWHSYFSSALPVFEAVIPYIRHATERVQVIANIGRAAAATGDPDRFYHAWDEVNAHKESAAEYRATALLSLGYGARTLGRNGLGREIVTEALHIASVRGQQVVAEHAQALLNSMGTHGVSGDRDVPPTAEMREMVDRLLGKLRRNRP
ncbi:MAG: hypothetical protein LC667_05100 [Thioalkalivibrio sp.]|nr:hypothetical protein [Thioalkalivibrio sp.]